MKRLLFPCLLLSLLAVAPSPASGETPERIEDLYNRDLAPFYHGVASGDPMHDGFIIWTRVTQMKKNPAARVPVEWIVATDAALSNVVVRGNTFATEERDFTVKVDIEGLASGHPYFYGFKAMGRNSPTGRTKTAPDVAVDQLKFAVMSCANYEWGYFSGYRKIANRGDLDAVVHVGDYIYEYPDNDSYSSRKIRDERVIFPSDEIVKLNDYRARLATYRLDPNLQLAHKRHPFIVIWDDHEFANDAWRSGAENHDSQSEGRWKRRKAAAMKAYKEWMPIRENNGLIHRTLSYGPLMDLILVDTRLHRDRQIYDVTRNKLYASDRTMLGKRQKAWLKAELSESDATWKILGNQVMFSEFNIGFVAEGTPVAPETLESLFLDIWDGYPAERSELVDYIADNRIDNTVILTGDIHCSFAFEVADPALGNRRYDPKTGKGAVAVEFVTPSLSAASFDEEGGDYFNERLERKINRPDNDTGINPNPHMKFADLDRHGYVVLTVRQEQVQADFYYLSNILRPTTTETWGAGFISAAGTNHLVRAKAPAPAKLAP